MNNVANVGAGAAVDLWHAGPAQADSVVFLTYIPAFFVSPPKPLREAGACT